MSLCDLCALSICWNTADSDEMGAFCLKASCTKRLESLYCSPPGAADNVGTLSKVRLLACLNGGTGGNGSEGGGPDDPDMPCVAN